MKKYMVIARYKTGTDFAKVAALIPDEQARVRELIKANLLIEVLIAEGRRTVFLKWQGQEAEIRQALESLPLHQFWDVELLGLEDLPPINEE
jgi:hypothetical protein